MAGIYAFTILLLIFAFGEIMAQKTKAVLSTTLVIAISLMLLFWTIFSPTFYPAGNALFQHAEVAKIGMILIGPLIVGIGTMMDFNELARQIVTVVVSVGCLVIGVVFIILVGPLFINETMAIAGAPIFAGANVATLIMKETLEAKGLADVATFCVLILVTQNLVGIPVTSQFLKREARKFINDPAQVAKYSEVIDAGSVAVKNRFEITALRDLSNKFDKPSAVFAKLALVSCLGFFLAGLTGGKVHYFVAALLMGVILSEIGFLEKNVLTKIDSGGFVIFVTTMVIFTNLAGTSPQQIMSMFFPLLTLLLLGVVGVIIAGVILAKIFKISPYLAISLGLTCTYGFPTTMFISKEVAEAVGRDETEVRALTNYILPKMIMAGIATVTIASVVVAGYVAANIIGKM